MASSLALRRLAGGSSLLNSLCRRQARSLAVAPSATRSYNTNTQMSRVEDDDYVDDDRRSDRSVTRRREFPDFFSVFDPFSPTRSVNQLMNVMDQLMENPFSALSRAGGRRGWDVKEDEAALQLKMDMPGLGKEDVKISVEENTLIIKGEGEKETDDAESRRRYSTRIDLTPNLYKVDGIKAEMKNGVLKVMIPKVKEEDRKDVFQVNIS
ncbi:Small heat shock protein, chloroplastic [Dionaea muscipula]